MRTEKDDIKIGRNSLKYIWSAYSDCGKERWVRLVKGENRNKRCYACAQRLKLKNLEIRLKVVASLKHLGGNKNYNWKGGRGIKNGYITVYIYPGEFFYPMADSRGYILEHRLVVAKALGRNLHSWEIVHHKGVKYPKGSSENKQDNRYPENLQLVSDDRHTQITILENKINQLQSRVTLLEAELTAIKTENAYRGIGGLNERG